MEAAHAHCPAQQGHGFLSVPTGSVPKGLHTVAQNIQKKYPEKRVHTGPLEPFCQWSLVVQGLQAAPLALGIVSNLPMI